MSGVGKTPVFLAELKDSVAYGLQRTLGPRISDSEARQVGEAVMHHMRRTLGGLYFYMQTGRSIDVSEKHWQIYKEYTGDNHVALSQKWKLTVVHIYRIIAACQAIETEKYQGKLL